MRHARSPPSSEEPDRVTRAMMYSILRKLSRDNRNGSRWPVIWRVRSRFAAVARARGCGSNPSEYPAQCKSFANVAKFFLVCEHVKNDRADVLLREATQPRSDLRITTDEVRTIRLISQKREQPVTILMKLPRLPGFVKAPFPHRIGVLHRVF